MTLGDIGNKMMVLIANRDERNRVLIAETELRLKELKRGIVDSKWVPLKPRGEMHVDLVALTFGKIGANRPRGAPRSVGDAYS